MPHASAARGGSHGPRGRCCRCPCWPAVRLGTPCAVESMSLNDACLRSLSAAQSPSLSPSLSSLATAGGWQRRTGPIQTASITGKAGDGAPRRRRRRRRACCLAALALSLSPTHAGASNLHAHAVRSSRCSGDEGADWGEAGAPPRDSPQRRSPERDYRPPVVRLNATLLAAQQAVAEVEAAAAAAGAAPAAVPPLPARSPPYLSPTHLTPHQSSGSRSGSTMQFSVAR